MSRAARISNLLAVIIPFVAFLAAIALFWGNGVGAHDLVLFAVMYLITGFGVTIGFHRLLTHRSFATSKPDPYPPPAQTTVRLSDLRRFEGLLDEDVH